MILFSAAITLVTTAIQLYREYKNDIEVIDSRMVQIRTGYVQGISAALWAVDHEQVKLILDGIESLPDIVYVEVSSKDMPFEKSGEKVSKNAVNQQIPLFYQYRGTKMHIGDLSIHATLSGVYSRLLNRVWIILLSNGIKTFLVGIFLLILFDRLVTRHIVKIANYIGELSAEDISKRLELERGPKEQYHDELSLLEKAINDMHDQQTKTFSELQASLLLNEKVISTSPIGISIYNEEGQCIAANESIANVIGKTKSQILVTEFGLGNFSLKIDTQRMRRVVINTFANACEAMLDETDNYRVIANARLSIITAEKDKCIEISFADTGIGITEELKEKIFEPLFSTKGFGVGLGMTTVKQIMGLHAGGVKLDTDVGVGTKITIWLPKT